MFSDVLNYPDPMQMMVRHTHTPGQFLGLDALIKKSGFRPHPMWIVVHMDQPPVEK
jgi:hypothetical protein